MVKAVAGDVAVINFPFSDLSGSKHRPALVLAQAEFGDLILCQITSNRYTSELAIELDANDFAVGALPVVSYARPDKLFTADASGIRRVAGQVKKDKLRQIARRVQQLFVVP